MMAEYHYDYEIRMHLITKSMAKQQNTMPMRWSSSSVWLPATAAFFALLVSRTSESLLHTTRSISNNRRHSLWQVFSQQRPAFSQPRFEKNSAKKDNSAKEQPTTRQHRPNQYGSDSKLGELHNRRIKTAGRVGTKRYVNPCKVFLGNLPFNATEASLQEWLCDQMGLPAPFLLNGVKIVRDWKTGDSKGYGFCVFTEPIHATVCIDKCNGRLLQGRAVRVDQGIKKQQTKILIKKDEKEPLDADETAIQEGIRKAKETIRLPDPEEMAMLRRLDPDLVDEYFQELNDNDLFEEEELDDEDYDGDEDELFEILRDGDEKDEDEEDTNDETTMNRQQRREAAQRIKRKKRPSKGFGSS